MKNEKIIEIEDRKKLPCPKCTSTKKKTEWEDGEFGGVNGAGYDTHGKYYEYALLVIIVEQVLIFMSVTMHIYQI